ncbi:hypothetical protein Rwratislav_08982 [Rhodococcus wratislaviensis IFP 2016]|nr:hypothetical protein Rwratislav_08982 [Rhodococcus wratislaviensis IFP 2016]
MVTATTIIAGTVMAPTPTRNATPDTPPNTTQPTPADTSTTHSPSRRDAQHFTDPTPPIARHGTRRHRSPSRLASGTHRQIVH